MSWLKDRTNNEKYWILANKKQLMLHYVLFHLNLTIQVFTCFSIFSYININGLNIYEI